MIYYPRRHVVLFYSIWPLAHKKSEMWGHLLDQISPSHNMYITHQSHAKFHIHLLFSLIFRDFRLCRNYTAKKYSCTVATLASLGSLGSLSHFKHFRYCRQFRSFMYFSHFRLFRHIKQFRHFRQFRHLLQISRFLHHN